MKSNQNQYIPTYYFSHHHQQQQQPPSSSSSKLYQYKTPRIQSSKSRRHPQTLHPRPFHQPLPHEIDSNSLPKINNNAQTTNIGPKRPLKILRNGPNEEEFKEDFSLIEAMWDDIGVLPAYRKAFETKARTLPKNQQKQLIKYENEELKHIRNNLRDYNKHFTNRNDAINKLKKYNEVFVQSYPHGKETLGDAFIKDIEKTINEIRIYSVNLITIFGKLRKLTSYGVNHGKYDLTKANKAYKYNNQILFLLDEDLSFLQWSPFWKYFKVNEEEYDTFLVNIASNVNHNNNSGQQSYKGYQHSSSNGTIINADIHEDLMNSIKKCQFIKKQEEIYYETDKLLVEEEQAKDFSYSSVEAGEIKLYGNKKMKRTQGMVRKLKLAQQDGDSSYLGANKGLYEDGVGKFKVRDEPYKIYRESGMSMSGEEYKKRIKEMEEQIEYDSSNHMYEAEGYKVKGKARKKKEIMYQEKDKDLESSKVENSYYDDEVKEDSDEEERRRQEEEEERKRQEEEEKKRKREEKRRQKEEDEKRRKREEDERRRKQEEEDERRRKREEEERRRRQQKEEEERRRRQQEEEEEERRKQEEEERKRRLQEEEERKRRQEEEERRRRQQEEEEERRRRQQEEEERKRREQEEERRRQEEEEEERRRREQEEEERRRLQEEEERRRREEEERKRKEEEEERRRQEEERQRREREEEERKRREEEERRRQEEEEEERKRQQEEEERRRKQEEEERRRQEEEEERRRQQEEEERRRLQEEEEERKRKEREEEERRRQQEEEERRRLQEEEERKRLQEEEEERKRQEEEERKRLQEEEEEKRRQQEEEEERKKKLFKINFLPISLLDYLPIINTYSQNIPQFQLQPLNTPTPIPIETFLQGNSPKIITSISSTNSNQLHGLCSVSYEILPDNLPSTTRLSITHISSLEDNWEPQISSFISFIIQNFSFTELVIKAYPSENESSPFLDYFTTTLNFTSTPFPTYTLLTYHSSSSTSTSVESPQIQPTIPSFTLDSHSIMALTFNHPDVSPFNYDKYINTVPLTMMLFKLYNDKQINIWKGDTIDHFDTTCIPSNTYSNTTAFNLNNTAAPNKISNHFDYSTLTLNQTSTNHSLQMNLRLMFANQLTLKYNNYIYNRIHSDISTYYDTQTGASLYSIQTLDNEMKLLIIELNSSLKRMFLDNNNNIYEIFWDWFNGLDEGSNEKKNIFIPSFTLNVHLDAQEIKSLPDDMIKVNDKDMFIESVDEYFYMKLGYDLAKDKAFHVKPNVNNDIVISDTFMVGVLNKKIYNACNLFTLQLNVVNKDIWEVDS